MKKCKYCKAKINNNGICERCSKLMNSYYPNSEALYEKQLRKKLGLGY